MQTSKVLSPRGGATLRASWLSLLLLLAATLVAADASAATYYIRTDGGDAAQCTGTSDAAYPGSGTGQACAWKHPFLAFPPAATPRVAGGDTVYIKPGSYMMGLGAPGATPTVCHQSWSWDCYMSPVPSGPSASQPTRIIGVGTPAPELWGTERASLVFNLQGSSHVEVSNLEITDHESCVDQHCHGGVCKGEVLKCNRDAAPWGKWAGTGISARDSVNVKLTDINVHGMANRGVFAGRLTDWTMTRLKIRGNGWAGWDGDLNGAESGNNGQIVFRELELSWNGCVERWPSGEPAGCWGQTAGGYGDGLGTGATAGHWLIEDSLIHHNTSDGLDLLYMREGGSVTIRRTWAEGNAGNQLKTKGNARLENNVVVGNCSYFSGHANMFDGDSCRALGNALSIGFHPTSRVDVVNNTITSEGDCLVLSGGGGTSAQLNLVGNVMVGQTDWRQPWEKSCAHYSDNGSEKVSWTRNAVSDVKNGSCPTGSLCGAPMLANASLSGFDPKLLAGSPLIDAGDAVLAPRDDHFRAARPSGAAPDIGAVEFGGEAGAPLPAPAPPPSEPTPEPTPPIEPEPEPEPEPVPAPAPAPAPAPLSTFDSVSVDSASKGPWRHYSARVRVVDGNGAPIAGATVSGSWVGAGVNSGSAVTGSDGYAEIAGGKLRNGRQATFCAESASAAGFDGITACASGM